MQPLRWLLNTSRNRRADPTQFGILFALMLLWLLVLAMGPVLGGERALSSALFAFITTQALLITARNGVDRTVFSVAGLFLLAGPLVTFPGWLEPATQLLSGVLILYVPVRLSVFVLEQKTVDVSTVFGALCAYLFMGLSWAIVYGVVAEYSPGAIALPEGSAPSLEAWTYFSFTTLTTLGYGDIAPRTTPARMLAIVEALIGQIYLVVVVARLVSAQFAHEERQD